MAEYFGGGHLRFLEGEWRDDDGNIVEVEEVKHGKWEDKGWDGDWAWQIDGHGNCWHVLECSRCGYKIKGVEKTERCGHCGAKMNAQ